MLYLLYIIITIIIAYDFSIRIKIARFMKKYNSTVILYETFCEILKKEDFKSTYIIVETEKYNFKFFEPYEIIEKFDAIVNEALLCYEKIEEEDISNEILEENARELIKMKNNLKIQEQKE